MAFALRASSAIGARPASASRRAAAPRSLGSALPIRSARRTSSPSSPSSSSRAAIAAPPTNAPNHSVDFVSVVFGSKMSSSSVPAEKGDKKALRPLQNGAFLSTSFPRSELGGEPVPRKRKETPWHRQERPPRDWFLFLLFLLPLPSSTSSAAIVLSKKPL